VSHHCAEGAQMYTHIAEHQLVVRGHPTAAPAGVLEAPPGGG
jgi:hypothetical protein